MALPLSRCALRTFLISILLFGGASACTRQTPAHKRALALGGDVMRAYKKALKCPTPEAVNQMAAAEGGLCPTPESCLEYRIIENKAGEQCGLAVVSNGRAGDIVLVPSSVWTTVELIESSAKHELEKAKK